jgi:hypothetical protein
MHEDALSVRVVVPAVLEVPRPVEVPVDGREGAAAVEVAHRLAHRALR